MSFFSYSAVKVHDSQAYRNMEMTMERISFTFDPIDTLLFLQMGFNFVRAAVACAILERISGLEPSSETTALSSANKKTTNCAPNDPATDKNNLGKSASFMLGPSFSLMYDQQACN